MKKLRWQKNPRIGGYDVFDGADEIAYVSRASTGPDWYVNTFGAYAYDPEHKDWFRTLAEARIGLAEFVQTGKFAKTEGGA